MEIVDKIGFWEKRACEDFKFAQKLFAGKDYFWCLFIVQLALEKALKARVIEKTKKEAPKIHDLYKLALIAGLTIKDVDIDNLRTITSFNVEARYDDYKENLKKVATKEYTEKYLTMAEEYIQWYLRKN